MTWAREVRGNTLSLPTSRLTDTLGDFGATGPRSDSAPRSRPLAADLIQFHVLVFTTYFASLPPFLVLSRESFLASCQASHFDHGS